MKCIRKITAIIAIVDNKCIKLPKVGYVKAVIHRADDFDWKIKSATAFTGEDGQYYISVLFEKNVTVINIKNEGLRILGVT